MVQVNKLFGVAEEKDRCVVANQVPVAFLSVILHGETTDVTLGVGCTALTGNSGKTHEDPGLFADF